MKKKLLVLTLCFTLIFSSLNYKKSYADVGVMSLPILATVSALAVGSNIIINNDDDLFDLGKMFYDYIDRHNDLNWKTVQAVFASSVSLQANKLVSVKSDFLDIVKEFFDNTFNVDNDIVYSSLNGLCGLKLVGGEVLYLNSESRVSIGTVYKDSTRYYAYFNLEYLNYGNWTNLMKYTIPINNKNVLTSWDPSSDSFVFSLDYRSDLDKSYGKYLFVNQVNKDSSKDYFASVSDITKLYSNVGIDINDFSIPYNGGYTWDNVDNKKENESISLPVPGNLGQLVGQNSTDFWDNTDGLVGSGEISVPVVDSPSISVDSSVNTFPSVDVDVPGVDSPTVPNDGIWATIKEFVIGLVVPGDTYWTDTWGGLYNNFTSSFPMVDMDGFNDLVTGEKKFPNIDINIMGVNGRVVNGDVINSIVDWLRSIVAGFMMLCLMLFNYRKIYKLIRNTEPFGGIAPGTSDFRTGISEYNKEPVVKAVDMAAEYRAWKENGGK